MRGVHREVMERMKREKRGELTYVSHFCGPVGSLSLLFHWLITSFISFFPQRDTVYSYTNFNLVHLL